MAIDDPGDALVHHDYTVVKNGVSSTFVWVPEFDAYQLIVPWKCGSGNTDKPVGFWVANRPPTGTENVDWAHETFGGFYAGKYEASRSDATPGKALTGSGATAGSSTTLKVVQNCVPWTNLTLAQAVAICQAYDPACHLIEDDEWTALAVWSMIRGVTVYGNNNSELSDVDDTDIHFVDDPSDIGADRSLTGSGMKAVWLSSTNLTTHSGTTAGVYDLNGNVWEWTATLGGAAFTGSSRYTVKGQDTGISTPAEKDGVSLLSTDPRLRRYGAPGGLKRSGQAAFGWDYFWWAGGGESFTLVSAVRGGGWYGDGKNAGVWCLYFVGSDTSRIYSEGGFGFRPILRF